MPEQTPFINVEFISNPEPRCPVVLLLDTSYSMQGSPIDELNSGVDLFASELNQDPLASKRVETAIITFGGGAKLVQGFTSPQSFIPPRFHAEGNTPMGEAVVMGLQILEERKQQYRESGIQYFRPWIFLITDGAPTDANTSTWREAVNLVHQGEKLRKLLFFGVAIQNADQHTLNQLCAPNRASLKLQGLEFRKLFRWLSSSLKSVSSADPGKSIVLSPPSSWTSIDV